MKTEIFKTKKVISLAEIIKYILFFVLLFVLSKAGIKFRIYPFAVGLYVALVWCNQNALVVSSEFLLASFLANFSVDKLFCNLFCVGIIMIVYYIHKLIKKPIKIWLLCIYLVLSQAFLIYQNAFNYQNLLCAFITILFSVLFMLACIKIFKTILVRGVGLKLMIDENICLCVLLASISLGLSNISIVNIELSKMFAMFVILLCSYIFSGMESIAVAVVLGLGEALNAESIAICGGYALVALSSLAFRTSHRYYSILAVLLMELCLGLYFELYGTYNIYSFLSSLIGAGLFALISKNSISVLKILINRENSLQASRGIINRTRTELCKKMYEMSNIFDDMNKTFRSMVRGVLPENDAKKMLTQEIMQKVCYDCPERFKCLRSLSDETNKVFEEIITCGLNRGKATILDVPPFLSTRCSRVNIILQMINQLILSYKQYNNMVSSMDSSRVLIADQLEGVSKLLSNLASTTQNNIVFDTEKEHQIVDELNYYNILASEVLVYQLDVENFNVTMTIRENDKDNQNIVKCISKICGAKMILCSQVVANIPNFYINTYKLAPKYDLVYGSSGCAKVGNSVSGDSYSFIRLSHDKILLAIVDGMGSGENAEQTSNTAINLIENFYKAGFDNEIILNSVNRFLSLNADENYSALDLCVVDLKTSSADFVKVGAPQGLIKHENEVEILQAGALPLGILEEMKPTIHKKLLSIDDMIVLTSDGVMDNFGGVEKLQKYINLLSSKNPQEIANNILSETMSQCSNRPNDDCTIICARVFDRV